MADQQRPPYPPAPPYPAQSTPTPPMPPMPPRPVVSPAGMPHVSGMKLPAGVKLPPRPMGYPMPAGMKMPPRPMGHPMPVAGNAPPSVNMPVAPLAVPEPVVPVLGTEDLKADEDDVDALWGSDSDQEPEEELISADQPEVDENGFINDLLPEEPEPEQEGEIQEESVFEPSPYEHNMASDLGLPPAFIKTKVLLPLFLFFLICGGTIGFFVSAMQNRSATEMPGVVNNAEIPKGRPRCGIAQKGQGCVLYLMNAQRREVEAKDFFGMASEILSIPKFQIETANIRYATMRIPPGYIALLNIPPM